MKDLRDQDLLVLGEHVGEPVGVAGFVLVVEFFPEALFHFLLQRIGINGLPEKVATHQREGMQKRFQIAQVLFDRFLHTGILYLHDDGRAVEQRSSMDLPERGGRKRFWFKGAKEIFDFSAELGLNAFPNHLEGHRWDIGLHHGQDFEDLGGEDVVAHAQHLHELEKGTAELLRPLDNQQSIPQMGIEDSFGTLLAALKGAFQGIDEIVAADLCGHRSHLDRPSGPAGGEACLILACRHMFPGN